CAATLVDEMQNPKRQTTKHANTANEPLNFILRYSRLSCYCATAQLRQLHLRLPVDDVTKKTS
ncbi:MAG: hypothetical protein VB876_17825, partial [Pirellulales bacterium]